MVAQAGSESADLPHSPCCPVLKCTSDVPPSRWSVTRADALSPHLVLQDMLASARTVLMPHNREPVIVRVGEH